MTTIAQFLDKITIGAPGVDEATASAPVRVSLRQISEACWGMAAFALFLLLGPFSVIAAVCSIFSLAKQANGPEPEALG